MSVGVVIVTHGSTAEALIDEAGFVLGSAIENIQSVAFNHSKDTISDIAEIRSCIEKADAGDGVLVLTDLMGSSPANLVSDVLEDYHAVMVTGVNLGMLICVCNYRDETLEIVVRKAVEGGRRAVKIFQK